MSKSKEERNSIRLGGTVSNAASLEEKVQEKEENAAEALSQRQTVKGCVNSIKEYGSV